MSVTRLKITEVVRCSHGARVICSHYQALNAKASAMNFFPLFQIRAGQSDYNMVEFFNCHIFSGLTLKNLSSLTAS